MAKITRKNQKIFADSAAASQITVFGSIKENSPNPPDYSKDPDLIQSNEFMQGWTGATQDDYAPYRQDMNAIQYLVTRQLAYLFQAGIPEYDSSTQYFANCSFCQINGVVYLCIQDALNKLPTTEPTYWKEIDFSKFAPKDSPSFTGNPTAPTQLNTDNSTKIATTAFVKNVLGGYAPIDSPTFTGTPTAPTPAVGDNSTKIATTHFVFNAMTGASINMPLFHHFWSDYEVNDVNFLRADTFSWQDGTAYEGPYNHLVADIAGKTIQTETVEGITIQFYEADDGHKICPASEESNVLALYTMSGVAWYYILDTVNQRFKLPRTKFGFTGLRNAVGKYVPETLPNASGHFLLIAGASIQESSLTGVFSMPNKNYTASQTGGATIATGPVEFNLSGSSSVYQNSAPVQQKATQMYLYFYVGNFTQTAIENTAGLNTSLFNGKVDIDLNNVATTAGLRRLVQVYNVGTDWYKVYDEYIPTTGQYIGKWCEQGGIITSISGTDVYKSVTLKKTLRDYTTSFPSASMSNCGYHASLYVWLNSNTQLDIRREANNASATGDVYWKVEGYIA